MVLSISKRNVIWVDAHVHLSFFNLKAALDYALSNFQQAMTNDKETGLVRGILCLAEKAGEDNFRLLFSKAIDDEKKGGKNEKCSWKIHQTNEPESLIASDRLGNRLFIIQGFQLETREKLEVLALLTNQCPGNGKTLKATLKDAIELGALAVIPWCAGKWTGNRGNIVSESIVKHNDTSPACLGDNGGRPSLWKHVPQFKIARKAGIPILRGSDSLPLAWEVKRIGSFGFKLYGDPDFDRPAKHLKALILKEKCTIEDFGNLENPIAFLRNQILIRLKKTRHRAPIVYSRSDCQ